MTAKFVVNGANTTITFEYTALTTKVSSIIDSCAEYLWNHGFGAHNATGGLISYIEANLTNQQKLNLVDQHVRKGILLAANINKTEKSVEATRQAEEANPFDL